MEQFIKNYNEIDDLGFFLILLNDEVSLEEKNYIFNNYSERIDRMNDKYYLQMLRQLDSEAIRDNSEIIVERVKKLSSERLDNTLYVNKYYHEVSDLANYLIGSEWFSSDRKYDMYKVAYQLEEMLKSDDASSEDIVEIGKAILSELVDCDHDVELVDMIYKNYIGLSEKISPNELDIFIRSGCKIINEVVSNDLNLTPNMIIFLCHMLKRKMNLSVSADFFEFYNDPTDSIFASYNAKKIRVNTVAVDATCKMFTNKKVSFQYLLFVLGHELEHAYTLEYKTFEKRDNLEEELKIHNASLGEALQRMKDRKFYLEYHDCFTHEFYANVTGIKTLYSCYEMFPSISDEDKIEINRILAGRLFGSYVLDSKTETYASSVDFINIFIDKLKDNMPGYAKFCLLDKRIDMPDYLEEVKNNLDEKTKFELGYYSKYYGITGLIANGDVTTVDIFSDLEKLYDEYGYLVEDKYPAYSVCVGKNKTM